MTHEFYRERDGSLYAAYDAPIRAAEIDERYTEVYKAGVYSILIHESLRAFPPAAEIISRSSDDYANCSAYE